MSKRIQAAMAIVPALLLIINTALIAQQPARATRNPPSSAGAAKAAEVAAAAGELLEEVSRLRGLKVLSPVKSGVKSRGEIEREIIRNFDESAKPEEIEAANKTLIAYGLAPKGFRYREFMIRLLTEQVAGFYRPKSKELFIADWNDLNQQKPILAHELVHALQDLHFDLRRFEEWPRGDSDRQSAIHALIEGDATGVMYNYQLKPSGTDITRLPDLAGFADQSLIQAERAGQKVFVSAPASIRESLVFPYLYGSGFVQQLVKASGWEAVSQAFTELPQSTEQIIHFEKYVAREMPVKVRLPDIAAMLGPGWKRIDTDVNGEFGYFLILSEFIGKKEARPAAAGWGGDQSTLYENAAKDRLLIAHSSVWDSVKDAREFFEAYAKRTRKRYPNSRELPGQSPAERRFQTPDGETFIGLLDQSVLILEGLNAEQADKLARLIRTLRE